MKSPPKKPKRSSKEKLNESCVIYARYSSHAQKDMSIEQQVALAREKASNLGLTVLEVYADRAISGRSDNRPAFQKMLRDAAKGAFKYVISWKSSRIGRNMLEAMINEARLSDCGVRLLYVEEDFEDNAAGRFALRTMMNVNQFYSESMAEDIRRGMNSNAEKCLVNGKLPFGYTKTKDLHIVIDEPNAEIVREIYKRVAKGEPHADILRSLNQRGIRTATNREWTKNSFDGILKNERYRGIYIYGDVRIEDGIPRIIDDELYFKAQEVLYTKKNARGRHRVYGDYLLTGKLYCGKCGAPMIGVSGTSRNGSNYYYYACRNSRENSGCDKKNVRRDDIEQAVANGIRENIFKEDIINWIADSVIKYQKAQKDNPEILLLKTRQAECQVAINNIMKAIEAGIFTDTTKDRLQELEAEKTDVANQINALAYNIHEVSYDEVVTWLESFREGDIKNPKYLNKLFSAFLVAVYLYDDGRLKIVFDIGDNTHKTVDLDFITQSDDDIIQCSYKPCIGPP